MKKEKFLSTQLIKSIFIPYFLVAITVTLGQVYIEFKNIQSEVVKELLNTKSVFQENLSHAYWTINKEGIEYNLKGIITNAAITGIEIVDLKGIKEYSLGDTELDVDKDVSFFNQWLNHSTKHKFPLRLEIIKDKGIQTVGWASIYTTNEVVYERVKYGFLLILINSIIKTLLLWFIVYYFIKKIVARPMAQTNEEISKLDFSHLKKINIKFPYQNELSRFITTLNALIGKVEAHQTVLEEKVEERTKELEIKNKDLNDALAIAHENITKVKLLTQAIEQTDDLISIVGTDGIIQYANESLSVHTGYNNNELIGKHTKIFKSGLTMPETYKELWNTVLDGKVYKNTLINTKKDKQLFHEEITITPMLDEDDKIISFIVTGQDVSEKIKIEKKLIALATRDTLTGIYNRNKLNESISNQIANYKRYGRSFSLLMIDIDHFKNVNDTYGHDIGDYILKELTSIISKSIRVNDIFGRWGGEEFILILPEESQEGAIELATKLKDLVANHIFEHVEKITISMGLSLCKENDTQDTLIKRADESLYKAKNTGRNRVCYE